MRLYRASSVLCFDSRVGLRTVAFLILSIKWFTFSYEYLLLWFPGQIIHYTPDAVLHTPTRMCVWYAIVEYFWFSLWASENAGPTLHSDISFCVGWGGWIVLAGPHVSFSVHTTTTQFPSSHHQNIYLCLDLIIMQIF